MTAQAQSQHRFIRKTTLTDNEYDTNFQKLDRDIIAAVSSPEADAVTPLMSKIYLRLLQAPNEYRESERVLRFAGETREGKWIKAWDQLCRHLRVSSETANKALTWMHTQGVIGYSAFKNGVGIRIFLNRAVSSIATRATSKPKKILPFAPASESARPASESETAFKDSFAVRDGLDSDLNPHAPKNGADKDKVVKTSSDPASTSTSNPPAATGHEGREVAATVTDPSGMIPIREIFRRLNELEHSLHTEARQAARREHERIRDWLENRGLPKVARVAHREAYKVLHKYGLISESAHAARSHKDVGRSTYSPPDPHPLSSDEITELAEACVALLETKGQAIEVTLSEMSVEAGGFLLPEDAPKVRARAKSLVLAGESESQNRR